MATGDFDVVQYPISYVGSEATERGLVEEARRLDVGLLGMKPFGGGRLGHARYCLGYVFRFPWVVPVIGFETLDELAEAVALAESGVDLTAEDLAEMERIKRDLGERFCRGCNYCHPCPQGIPVLEVMFFDVFHKQFGEDWVAREAYRETIGAVAKCEECGSCVSRCPFDLEVPVIMRDIVDRYQQMMRNRE
jgi:predicted aldo/keto reductase-like oxidoreductase